MNYVAMGGGLFGVILLNMGSKSKVKEDYPYLQYGLLNGLIFACLLGSAQIIIKLMNKSLHFIYTTFFSGFAGIWIILYCLLTGYTYTFSQFDLTDYLLVISGTGLEIVGITNSIAFNYGEVQILAPIFHANLVVCILIDVIFLGYRFSWNEAVGGLIIVVSLGVPVIRNL